MRRGAVALELEHGGHRFRLQIGRYPDGALGEVFVDMHKGGSTLDALAATPPSLSPCFSSTARLRPK
jgi:hypothetical protein